MFVTEWQCHVHLHYSVIDQSYDIQCFKIWNTKLSDLILVAPLLHFSDLSWHNLGLVLFYPFSSWTSSRFLLNCMINSEFFIHFRLFLHHGIHVLFADCLEFLFTHLSLFHPSVPENVSHSWSRRRLFGKNSLDKFFEVGWEHSIAIFFLIPELFSILAIISREKVVWFIFDWVRFLPGISDDLTDEEWNSKCKQVCILALVWHSLIEDFWCHVHWRSKSCVCVAILFPSCQR